MEELLLDYVKEKHIVDKILKDVKHLEYMDKIKSINDKIREISKEIKYYSSYIKIDNNKRIKPGYKSFDLMTQLNVYSHNTFNKDIKIYNDNKGNSVIQKIACEKLTKLKFDLTELFMKKDKIIYFHNSK